MRILVAVDKNPYSDYVIKEASGLAANTWADITLLGLSQQILSGGQYSGNSEDHWNINHPFAETMRKYRKDFLDIFRGNGSPYGKQGCGYELVEVKKGVWEEMYVCRTSPKDLRIRIRMGNPAKEILAESRDEESDLIVLGCSKGANCVWEGSAAVPEKVVNDATCSTLVIKEEKTPDMIVCCLDHHTVTQESLELVNQLVTLHKAELEIVGVTNPEGLSNEVEKKMEHILEYYTARKIKAWLKLVAASSLESFISDAAQRNLVALWMGKQSLLEKFLPRKSMSKFVKTTHSSVLILR